VRKRRTVLLFLVSWGDFFFTRGGDEGFDLMSDGGGDDLSLPVTEGDLGHASAGRVDSLSKCDIQRMGSAV